MTPGPIPLAPGVLLFEVSLWYGEPMTKKNEAPRTYYRGSNPGDARRIKTGNDDWDSHLFVTDHPDKAKSYGSKVDTVDAAPDAKILHHKSKEYKSLAKGVKGNLLETSSEIAKRAKSAGYDAVYFERQGDVGTAVLNKDKFAFRK